jgi:hypothetical protein
MSGDMRNELSLSDRQVVEALIDEHYPFDCDVIPINENTWAIHGPVPFAGEAILAEFSNKSDAEVALELLSAAEARTSPAMHQETLT